LAAAWFDDEGARAKVQTRVDEQAKAEEAETARKKTLADEEEAAGKQVTEVAHGCVEQLPKKHKPKHPSVTLQLAVTTEGDVQSVDEAKGSLEPAPLRKCVVEGVKKLKLANTSGADRKLALPVALH
jgi:hypothetical protein